MKVQTLDELFVHELKDLHSVESQLIKAIPKMAKLASHEELREALLHHLEETKTQLERIERIFEKLEQKPGRHKCKALEGILAEGEELVGSVEDEAVRDAAIILSAQRVEHYEIAAYGCARAIAETLGRREAIEWLQKSLDEEGQADKKLTELAEEMVNAEAEAAGGS